MKRFLSKIAFLVMILSVVSVTVLATTQEVAIPEKSLRKSVRSYNSVKTLEKYVDIEEFEKTLFDAFSQCAESVDISSYNLSYTNAITNALGEFVYNEMQECFHIEGIGVSVSGAGKILRINASYNTTAVQFKSMYAELISAKDKLLQGIVDNDKLDDVKKALLLHDRLALLCEYDYNSSDHRYDVYGALVNGVAVCQGYAEAYDYLLEAVGIESYYCSSDMLNHGWNIVYINGKPYHVDVTWDDGAWGNGKRGAVGAVDHDNFLRSSAGIYSTNHTATDYDTFPTDTTYDNYFWQSSNSAFQLIGNELYYIDNNTQQLKRYSDQTVLCSVEDNWKSEHGYWGNYARLAGDGTSLFYSLSKAVYRYDLSSCKSTVLLKPTLGTYESIYGFEYADGYLVCDINNTPPYSAYGIANLRQIKQMYDTAPPTAALSATNDLASSQTVTLKLSDNAGIAGYYWGTNSSYSSNTYTATTNAAVEKTVSSSGTYYLTVKDTSGNLSQTKSIRFYKTTLNGNGATVSPSYVITAEGNSFTFPTVSKDGYQYKGWATSSTATTGQTSLTPTKNATYYAVFEKLVATVSGVKIEKAPTKTVYYVGDSLDTTGLKLRVTYSDGSTKTVTDGFTVSGFNSGAIGAYTATVTVSYQGFADTFTVTVKMPSVTLSPSSKNMEVGDSATITATTEPSGQAVTWTSSNSAVASVSAGTVKAKSAGTSTITVKFTYNGIEYSKTCKITVSESQVQITAHPCDRLAQAGGQATFTVEASNATAYRWQYRRSATGAWSDTSMSGYNTDTLTVAVTAARNGYQYRCVVTGNGGEVYSDVATLHVVSMTHPVDQTAHAGETVTFTVGISLDVQLQYQWQYRRSETGKWSDTTMIGCKTDTLSVEVTNARDGYQYRCIITLDDGTQLISDPATLYVTEPTLTSVSVAQEPAKTVYEIGESLDITGLTLTATYSNGSTETVTSGFTFSVFDSATTGIKTVTVTYEGKSAAFTVMVIKSVNGEVADGWIQENGKWYYYEKGVAVKNQWRKDSKGWVYIGKDGYMLTNAWCTDSQGWCYVGADGYAVTNCWKQDSTGWIWLNANGSMTKNQWIQDGGKWYWLNASGYMVTNQWQQDSKGWVYIGSGGYMLTNAWCTDSKGWCYVGADGYAVTNCWKQDSIGWIYLDSNGSMTKNQWVKDSTGWCYLNSEGYMVTNGWAQDSQGWYWMESNGYAIKNTSKTIDGKIYYFNASGLCTNH